MKDLNINSLHNQRQLPHPLGEIVQEWPGIFQQMERWGCPPATVTRIRKLFRIALARTVVESERRDFLLDEIKRHVKFLSGFPETGAPEALDGIENLALQLPDKEEQQRVLRWLPPLRKCLLEGGGR